MGKVRVIPWRRESAAWNLALEEALYLKSKNKLLLGESVQPIVKLYSFSKPTVVLGYMQKINDIDIEFCKDQDIDYTMRTTGGGSVYLGRNELQYSVILPEMYSKEKLSQINQSLSFGFQDIGIHPNLAMENNHKVLRIQDKSFVFDAQRRFKDLFLHHGTALVEEFDFELQGRALKASKEETKDMQQGQLFLKDQKEFSEKKLIKSFERSLPGNNSIIKKDFTQDEIKLAKKLYKNFYTDESKFSHGKKEFGICYLPTPTYNMEKYSEVDE